MGWRELPLQNLPFQYYMGSQNRFSDWVKLPMKGYVWSDVYDPMAFNSHHFKKNLSGRFCMMSSSRVTWRHSRRKIFFPAKGVILYTVENENLHWFRITFETGSENEVGMIYLKLSRYHVFCYTLSHNVRCPCGHVTIAGRIILT